MRKSKAQLPVILLLDDGSSADKAFVRSWLDQSRFNTSVAHDIFGALEELSDFTMATRPDVICLNVSADTGQASLLREMVSMTAGQLDAAIISMAGTPAPGRTDGIAADLRAVEARLETLIPNLSHSN